MRIVLVGMPGCGKSTIGRQLSSRLNYDFIDTDEWLESRHHLSMTQLIEQVGVPKFRLLETEALKQALVLDTVVIATGGGIILKPDNRRILQAADLIVMLEVDPVILCRRLETDNTRPFLEGAEGKQTLLQKLYEERQPLYQDVADYILDSSQQSIEQSIEQCLDVIRQVAQAPR